MKVQEQLTSTSTEGTVPLALKVMMVSVLTVIVTKSLVIEPSESLSGNTVSIPLGSTDDQFNVPSPLLPTVTKIGL